MPILFVGPFAPSSIISVSVELPDTVVAQFWTSRWSVLTLMLSPWPFEVGLQAASDHGHLRRAQAGRVRRRGETRGAKRTEQENRDRKPLHRRGSPGMSSRRNGAKPSSCWGQRGPTIPRRLYRIARPVRTEKSAEF